MPYQFTPGVSDHVMYGHACRIRRLTTEEMALWPTLDLGQSKLKNCVAVYGEDLGECLAAVVDVVEGRLVWSDADGLGNPIPEDNATEFARAVCLLLTHIFPHLQELG